MPENQSSLQRRDEAYTTTPEKDLEVIAEIKRRQDLAKIRYHASRDNCSHFVSEVLEATDVDPGLANYLHNRKQKGSFITEPGGYRDYFRGLSK